MAGVRDNALIRLLGWPQGLDNLTAETELPIGQRGPGGEVLGALRVAENLDLNGDGKPRRRPGYALVGYPGMHSAYAHPEYPYLLAVHDGALCWLDADEAKAGSTPLAAPHLPMSYAYAVGWVYYANGIDCGRVNAAGFREEWGLLPPLGVPALTASAVGGLYAGTYQVALTYLDANGRESGASLSEQVELAEGQGVLLTQIPQSSDPAVTTIRVYATAANGTVLYAAADLPAGTTSYLIGVHQPGKALDTEFAEPLPSGHIVRFHNGRQYVARDRVLYWSDALHYGQGWLANNYLMFNARIDLVEGVGQGNEAGLFVAAGERTYYLAGADPNQWQRRIVHPVGAVPRSSVQVDRQVLRLEGSGEVPYWLDRSGQFVVGVPGGVIALHKDRYAGPAQAEAAATVLREAEGDRYLLTMLRGGVANGLGIVDTVEAEVWKNGVRIA